MNGINTLNALSLKDFRIVLIKERSLNQDVYTSCIDAGYPEIIARLIAGRKDVFNKNIFEFSLDAIQPAMTMAGVPTAVDRIVKAIYNDETILIFTDYDVDGCTSMAIRCIFCYTNI
ncbi:hypothetical protein [Desulfobacter latus]|uniref:Single-stranded-DNA-specific exonuclease RecJ n=1 Tax=Desulfobacter latus TaxID=2292 RepID=A0A850TB88_9BACT|nr:hypothetical protein [Desulfobacter latus]NWH06912.1 hypothetical protein [Desulfobacter latus]